MTAGEMPLRWIPGRLGQEASPKGTDVVMEETIEVLKMTPARAALGVSLLLAATAAGWRVGRERHVIPTRVLETWVRCVVLRLVRQRSWCIRFAAILVNNGAVLSLLIVVAPWRWAALTGIALLGISLGIGLRVLSSDPDARFDVGPVRHPSQIRRIRLGVLMNLLEPPAIALTVGLALTRSAVPLTAVQTWSTFLFWVVPATMIAAAGEATWLGVCLNASRRPSEVDSQ